MRVDLRSVIVKASTAASAFLIASTLFAGLARASHYATADVPRLIDAPQVEKLHKAGVETT
ncbi:MAG TPA: hypothetical protein VH560_11210, partial [Polyangia bacterium]|nr:hypothetical protein [Polyangia bacterium]